MNHKYFPWDTTWTTQSSTRNPIARSNTTTTALTATIITAADTGIPSGERVLNNGPASWAWPHSFFW